MSIRQLEYVLEIVKRGSMRGAAFNLFVSEATISQQIGKLENELSVTLFHRRRRTLALVLTDDGEQILPKLQRMVDAHDAVLAQAAKIKERQQLAEQRGA